MDFQHVMEHPLRATADVLGIVVFGDPGKDSIFREIDKQLEGTASQAAKDESFEGKPQQILTLSTGKHLPWRRVIVVGGGPKGDLDNSAMRDLAAQVATCATKLGAKSVAYVVPATRDTARAVQLAAEGVRLGCYKFSKYLSAAEAKKPSPITTFGIITDARGKKPTAAAQRTVKAAIARAEIVATAICRARDWVNEPAAAMTPSQLAAEAKELTGRHKTLSLNVLGPKECAKLGMGMFLAVGQGSDQEPRLIHLIYKPAKKAKRTVVLIGKGVTFDSGGYSLKPSQSMEDMKVDMAGAAAVLSSMEAIAALGGDVEVHAIAACCENLVSGRAYKLGDVLTSMDGITVEINNTDAEGRLTLGDAITYARTHAEPDVIYDFATLTGACMVALGPFTAGVLSDHRREAKAILDAAARAGEDLWQLPLNPRLKDQLKSSVADMRNTGDRFGGAITAGLFLQAFAKDTPWVHVDLAGPASTSSPRPSQARGGTGFAVATIIELVAR